MNEPVDLNGLERGLLMTRRRLINWLAQEIDGGLA